ncbi:MAG: 4'-phosphopantetheinyl transferase superfamily protein [Chloroflexi bacterium]|nr:4'-phosphopantetheinyl transferase superfamily protein [Chloroflexota bacterium]
MPVTLHGRRADLNLPAAMVEGLSSTLATDEITRAARFHFERHRDRFVVARGLLRAILGRYLCVEPDQVRFRYGANGKPALADEFDSRLHFNLAHSGWLALYAITWNREIGIDLECVRSEVSYEDIAGTFFSSGEASALHKLPAADRSRAFLACWTRKEAYAKAKGVGLGLPLSRCEVSLVPGAPAVLLNTWPDPLDGSRYFIVDLDPGPGYVAALAVEGDGWRLRSYQVPCIPWFSCPP